jgi:hypothetical protein
MPISGTNGPDMDTDSSGPVPEGPRTVLTLLQAARVLKIQPDALRKRIQRGKVEAYKEDGQWRVVVDMAERSSAPALDTRPVLSRNDLLDRLQQTSEELGRYKAIAERSESTLRESEQHYKDMIAELQARVKELDRRPWWRRGKHEQGSE